MNNGLFVFYLNKIEEQFLRLKLSQIFNTTIDEVSELLSDNLTDIKYQIRDLKQTPTGESDNYCIELNLFMGREMVLKAKYYNELSLGLVLSKFLELSIVIKDKSEDPYQWILISNDNAFLFDEIVDNENDNYGCVVIDHKTRRRLSIEKALKILPDKSYYAEDAKPIVYYVRDPKLWETCLCE